MIKLGRLMVPLATKRGIATATENESGIEKEKGIETETEMAGGTVIGVVIEAVIATEKERGKEIGKEIETEVSCHCKLFLRNKCGFLGAFAPSLNFCAMLI